METIATSTITIPLRALSSRKRSEQTQPRRKREVSGLECAVAGSGIAMTHAAGRLSKDIVRTTGTFLNEKGYQMRKTCTGRRLGAATALFAVTLVAGGLAMAPAASASTAPVGHAKLNSAGSPPPVYRGCK